MKGISILGATGSIGVNTLDIVARHPDKYRVIGLSAYSNEQLLIEQVEQFKPVIAVIGQSTDSVQLAQRIKSVSPGTELIVGEQGLTDIAEHPDADMVMAAIVGAAGLIPTLAAVDAGKKVLLANKESLVMSGELFMQRVAQSGAQLLPIDSEHNAIFQSLPVSSANQSCDLKAAGVQDILLTGSGGPFLNTPLDEFAKITPAQACKHPNWSMGQKISVDSATMMNKGLEFIEARWLFNASPEQIKVVIHPQSVIHSMVRYSDGSVLAQMGNPDMRTPIAHAMAFPSRIESGVEPLDFFQVADFTFQKPCYQRYPNLKLALQACEQGQAASTALNAANEISVAAFLNSQIGFNDIARTNDSVLQQLNTGSVSTLEDILAVDQWARSAALNTVKAIG